jgi:hypothetical protein
MLNRQLSLFILLISFTQTAFAVCDGQDSPLAQTAQNPLTRAISDLKKANASGAYTSEQGVSPTDVIDLTTQVNKILSNSNDPQFNQTYSDYMSAHNLFAFISTPKNGTPPTPVPLSSTSGPIQTSTPVPQTPDELAKFLQSMKNSMTVQAKILFVKMNSEALGDYGYGNDPTKGAPPTLKDALSRSFQALKNKTPTAGECGPIHTQGKGSVPGNHAIACFRDPDSKKYYWINYDDVTMTRSEYLSEAAEEQSLNMTQVSMGTYIATKSLSHPNLHQIQTPRARSLVKNLHRASDPSEPAVAVEVGSTENIVVVHRTLVGVPHANVGAYALGINKPTEGLTIGTAGVSANLDHSIPLSNHLSVDTHVDAQVGLIGLSDTPPAGNAFYPDGTKRSTLGTVVAVEGKSELAWDTAKNKGDAGVKVEFDDTLYGFKPSTIAAGDAYNSYQAFATEHLNSHVEIHAQASAFIGVKSMWNQDHLSILPASETVGTDITANSKNGKIKVENKTDAYVFGKISNGAYGIRDDASVSYETNHHVILSVAGEGTDVVNHSNDEFYDYGPTCVGQGSVKKEFSKFSVEAKAQETCNTHRPFALMQEGSLTDGYAVREPRGIYALKINF